MNFVNDTLSTSLDTLVAISKPAEEEEENDNDNDLEDLCKKFIGEIGLPESWFSTLTSYIDHCLQARSLCSFNTMRSVNLACVLHFQLSDFF